MALLYMESFDHYVTADITEKLGGISNATINTTAGRRGSGAVATGYAAAWNTRSFATASTTIVMGTAIKIASPGGQTTAIFSVRYLNDSQATISVTESTGQITARRGFKDGTVLATGTGTLLAGVYGYVEAKILLHTSAGAIEVRLNGTTIINITGVNTADRAHTLWDNIYCGNGGSSLSFWDDFYLLDGTGSAPWNTFLGDCRVDAFRPTGAGATTGFTPSTGANWQCVDDAAPNDDTDYTSAASAGLTDTFVVPDVTAGATVYGVQHCLATKKTDAGACTVAPVVRHSGVNYPGTALGVSTDYAVNLYVQETNPGTGVQWTEAGFNAAEFGYTRVS